MSSLINKTVIAKQVFCHAWNKDSTAVAICPGTPEIQIFDVTWKDKTPTYTLAHSICAGDSPVVSMSWDHNYNRIAVCSHDRSAHVLSWSEEDAAWKIQLVLLNVTRAVTDIQWSHSGNKFVVTTGNKTIAFGNYNAEHDWWVVRDTSKVVSDGEFSTPAYTGTVTCADWHSGDFHVATGSTDGTLRVVAGYVKAVDEKPGDLPFPRSRHYVSVFEDACGSWINAVRFNPSGTKLAVFCQASTIRIYDVETKNVIVKKTRELPMTSAVWVNDETIVAGGHDCNAYAIKVTDEDVTVIKLEAAAVAEGPKKAGFGNAMSMFQGLDARGTTASAKPVAAAHGSAICGASLVLGVNAVSTVAFDGSICIWKY